MTYRTDERVTIHCWEDRRDDDTGESFSCLLPDKHEGPHQWTPDSAIEIVFKDKR